MSVTAGDTRLAGKEIGDLIGVHDDGAVGKLQLRDFAVAVGLDLRLRRARMLE